MARASKRAKGPRDSQISTTGAVAASIEDNGSNVFAICPPLSVQNNPSRLLKPGSQFGKGKSLDHQESHTDSLDYARSVLAGAESLGIEMMPHLQRDLGYRRGQAYIPGSFSDGAFKLTNGCSGGAAACDMEDFEVSRGYYETVHDFELGEDDWGSDYAGIGHQFANLSVREDKTQLRQ